MNYSPEIVFRIAIMKYDFEEESFKNTELYIFGWVICISIAGAHSIGYQAWVSLEHCSIFFFENVIY